MASDAIIVADLGFGDAGKGGVVDFLARDRDAHTVVRYNGGAQAAHNVITPDGRHHTFAQFGSATFLPGVRTHLSRFMVVNPLNLVAEEEGLRRVGVFDAMERLTIDARAPITTPFHVAANRLREIARGDKRHGSCGVGVGETVEDARAGFGLVADDLRRDKLVSKLRSVQMRKRAELAMTLDLIGDEPSAERDVRDLFDDELPHATAEVFSWIAHRVKIVGDNHLGRLLAKPGVVIFEGAQGVLLDQWFGFWPHTTWSDTTFTNAVTLIREHGPRRIQRLGVLRAYATRHGAGPLPTEDEALTFDMVEQHNTTNAWQGPFRAGWTDLVLIRYAVAAAGRPDGIVVTHLDKVQEYADQNKPWSFCFAYDAVGRSTVTDLVPPPASLEHGEMVALQGALTKFLEGATPVCGAPRRANPAGVADLIGEAAGAPVVLESWGATATAKRTPVRV